MSIITFSGEKPDTKDYILYYSILLFYWYTFEKTKIEYLTRPA